LKILLTGAAIFLMTTCSFASPAPKTGLILLQGAVTQKISVAVTAQAIASTLDLSTTQTDLLIASVNEKSNSKTGYKLTIASANLSQLKRTNGPEVFPYTLKYNGSAVPLTSVAGTSIINPTASTVSVNKNVSISYTGKAPELMVEGSYADNVIFTIAAN
jgi:hypothetical protein